MCITKISPWRLKAPSSRPFSCTRSCSPELFSNLETPPTQFTGTVLCQASAAPLPVCFLPTSAHCHLRAAPGSVTIRSTLARTCQQDPAATFIGPIYFGFLLPVKVFLVLNEKKNRQVLQKPTKRKERGQPELTNPTHDSETAVATFLGEEGTVSG